VPPWRNAWKTLGFRSQNSLTQTRLSVHPPGSDRRAADIRMSGCSMARAAHNDAHSVNRHLQRLGRRHSKGHVASVGVFQHTGTRANSSPPNKMQNYWRHDSMASNLVAVCFAAAFAAFTSVAVPEERIISVHCLSGAGCLKTRNLANPSNLRTTNRRLWVSADSSPLGPLSQASRFTTLCELLC
jgi:hypothetical protein